MAENEQGEAMPKIRDLLPIIAEKNKALGELDSKLSAQIKRVEKALQQHVSIRVSIDITAEDDCRCDITCYFSFTKIDGKWGFAHERYFEQTEETSVETLLGSSREARLAAFTHGYIEKLIRTATSVLDNEIAARSQAIETANALVSELEKVRHSDF